MTLAGVTTLGGLFVLEMLAADRGLRVLNRGEHVLVLHSWIIAPRELVSAPV
jgi:hypothetical protein